MNCIFQHGSAREFTAKTGLNEMRVRYIEKAIQEGDPVVFEFVRGLQEEGADVVARKHNTSQLCARRVIQNLCSKSTVSSNTMLQ